MTKEELEELRKLLTKFDNEQASKIMGKHNLKVADRTQLIKLDDFARVLEGCEILINSIDDLLSKS